MQQPPEISREELEKRRSKASQRQRTPLRRAYYFAGTTVLKLLVRLLWRSYRVQAIVGKEWADAVRQSETPHAPCIWHGQLVLAGMLCYRWINSDGYKVCLVVSPSVDGDAPAKFASDLGAKVIRGSKNSSGARVLSDMRRMFRDGYSIVTAADGPTGPGKHFKVGVVLMAKVAKVPMVPMAFYADRAWYLRRWDNFMIPKPFARIGISFGEPILVPKEASVRELEPWRAQMELALNQQDQLARNALEIKAE